MSKKTKISLIAAAGILLAIVAILITNFIVNPVYKSYQNEDGELRVEIDGAVYKYLPDTEWRIDGKPTNHIGYLDKINTTLQEYEGDSGRSALYVSAPANERLMLIKEEIELGSLSADNVYLLKFDDPDINKYFKIIIDASFETTDEKVIESFFTALRESGSRIAENEVIPEEGLSDDIPIGAFVLKCYNKNLPIAATSFHVLIWRGQYICYDEIAGVFVVIPAEVFSEIAGGDFDAEALLGDD